MYQGNALKRSNLLSFSTIAVAVVALIICLAAVAQAHYESIDPATASAYAVLALITLVLAVVAAVISDILEKQK